MNIPLIISCPLVGAELTRDIYPNLPLTPDEIADAAKDAVGAGASIIHLHVRDKDGKPSQSVEIFKEVTEKIKERCDCIIQYSTGGAVGTDVAERCAPLSLKPEMATLSMGTMNFAEEIYENSFDTITEIARNIQKYNVFPELEIFDYGMMDTLEKFVKKELLPEKFHIDFVLGVPGGMSGTIHDLLMLTQRLSENQTWSVAGVGRFQLPLLTHAIAMGGHIRVGIEDNIYYLKGELAESNTQLIERAVRIANELDRDIASVEDARNILEL
ncbi:MAG: 3-keto-5-aminohexanoate cleavage protein [Desulfobacterales bacterium]|nr:3-keto-5-aminohexanoate cleavage protein [Desulfobacterales bacterium]